MAVALLALFVAMGGTAIAAHHYLINSINQINPKVVKKLKGNTGPPGPQGAPGTAGTAGAAGAAGAPGANAIKYFAQVNGEAETPTLAFGSPGVTVSPARPFEGAATVEFPTDMSKCAITVTAFNGGLAVYGRQSSISESNKVVVVTYNDSKEATEADESFNIIAAC
jgi:hypothetical protein